MDTKEILEKLQNLILQVQSLETRVEDLEKGEFGTGVYLDGCTEADKEYISKREGE